MNSEEVQWVSLLPGKPVFLAIIFLQAAAAVQCPNVVYKCTHTQVPTMMKWRAIIFFILLLKKEQKPKKNMCGIQLPQKQQFVVPFKMP